MKVKLLLIQLQQNLREILHLKKICLKPPFQNKDRLRFQKIHFSSIVIISHPPYCPMIQEVLKNLQITKIIAQAP